MKKILLLLAASAFFAAACSKAPQAAQPGKGERHSSVGVIKSFGEQGKTVVIEHQAFPDGFMEGMTMSFELQSPKMALGLAAGDKVAFTLENTGNGFPVVAISKLK
jgi:Cu/Ag efflux protein CusF